jgi:hypothetical protein
MESISFEVGLTILLWSSAALITTNLIEQYGKPAQTTSMIRSGSLIGLSKIKSLRKGLPDYEKVWQQFLNARSAAHSSDPTKLVLTLSPETQLGVALTEINPKAFARAKKEVGGKDAGAIIDWFVKNEGLGSKNAYEKAWQEYLSSLAKEREPRPQPIVALFPQQPAVAPYEPGASAPEKTEKTIVHGPQTLQDAPQQSYRMCARSLLLLSQGPKPKILWDTFSLR